MEFFQKLLETSAGLDLRMTIKRVNDKLSVSIIPDKLDDILPLILTGTAEELDEGFFEHIRNPLEKVAGIVSNAAEVEQAAEKAKEQPAPVTTTKDKKAAAKPAPTKAPVKKSEAPKEKKPEPPANPFTAGVKIIVTAVQNPAHGKIGAILEQTAEQAAKYKGYILAEFEAPVGKKMVPVDHIQLHTAPARVIDAEYEEGSGNATEQQAEVSGEKISYAFSEGSKVIVNGPGKLRGEKGTVVNPEPDKAGEILVDLGGTLGQQYIDAKSLDFDTQAEEPAVRDESDHMDLEAAKTENPQHQNSQPLTHEEIKEAMEAASNLNELHKIFHENSEAISGSEWLGRIYVTREKEVPSPATTAIPAEVNQ